MEERKIDRGGLNRIVNFSTALYFGWDLVFVEPYLTWFDLICMVQKRQNRTKNLMPFRKKATFIAKIWWFWLPHLLKKSFCLKYISFLQFTKFTKIIANDAFYTSPVLISHLFLHSVSSKVLILVLHLVLSILT